MFRAIDLYQAASETSGVVISCIEGRLSYRRHDHELVVRREAVRGRDIEPVQTVFLTRPEWLPPYHHETIGEDDRERIAAEIVAACRTFGIETEVVGR